MNNVLAVRILAIVALVFTVLAGIGWMVVIGGFGSIGSSASGPSFAPHYGVSILSPILFIVMIVKSIMMIVRDELFRKFYIIHTLAVIAFIMTAIVLCFLGYLLGAYRPSTSYSNPPDYVNALFGGALLEVLFLIGAWTCHILAHLFGGMPVKSDKDPQ